MRFAFDNMIVPSRDKANVLKELLEKFFLNHKSKICVQEFNKVACVVFFPTKFKLGKLFRVCLIILLGHCSNN